MNKIRKQLIYVVTVLNLTVILYFWWQGSSFDLLSGGDSLLLALGRLAGLLLVLTVLVQFLLMGRSTWIEKLFGLDKLSRVHHYVGLSSLIFLFAHPLLITIGTAGLLNTGILEQYFATVFSAPEFIGAVVALWFLVAVIIFSITIIRRRWRYEAWYFTHLLVYVAVFASLPHQFKFGTDLISNNLFTAYWIALYSLVAINHLYFRFVRPLYKFHQHRFRVDRVERENQNVVSVYIKGKNLDKFPVQPGQFMIFRFLDHKRWWQAHPFSLSKKIENNELRISVKASGDFSALIGSVQQGTEVIIDGPFGVFTDKEEASKILLIAGGIGITPLRTLFEQMQQKGKDVILLNNNKTPDDMVFKNELTQINPDRFINIFTDNEGHLNQEKIKNLVPDLNERLAYVCGPPAMIKAIQASLIKLGVSKDRIKSEKFSL